MSDYNSFADVFRRLDQAAVDKTYKDAEAGPFRPPGGFFECLGVGSSIRTWNDEKNKRVVPIVDLKFQIVEADTGDPKTNAKLVGRQFSIGYISSPGKIDPKTGKPKQSFGASRFKSVVEKMFNESSDSLQADFKRVHEGFEDTYWRVKAKESLEYDTDLQAITLISTGAEAAAG